MPRRIKRRRPHISVTPSQETLDLFLQIGQERGLDALGVIMDFIVHDYVRLRDIELALQPWSTERAPLPCPAEVTP